MTDHLRMYGYALDVLDCVAATLDGTAMRAPDRRCVTAGPAVDEECCDRVPGGGQLTVSLIRTYQSLSFPAETFDVIRCGQATVVLVLEIKILRCATIIDQNGTPPSCEEQSADAMLTAVDASAVLNGVSCCFEPERVAIGPQVWLESDTCLGTTTTVFIDAGQAACCGN